MHICNDVLLHGVFFIPLPQPLCAKLALAVHHFVLLLSDVDIIYTTQHAHTSCFMLTQIIYCETDTRGIRSPIVYVMLQTSNSAC